MIYITLFFTSLDMPYYRRRTYRRRPVYRRRRVYRRRTGRVYKKTYKRGLIRATNNATSINTFVAKF